VTDDGGRPLDAREQDEFEAILTGYRRTARRPGDAPPPAQVALVLTAALLVAVLTALLPAPLNLWVPVAVLAAVAAVALVRGVSETSGR
jgi:Flp pilus assembly protein TadB